jgi:hypothetical protein
LYKSSAFTNDSDITYTSKHYFKAKKMEYLPELYKSAVDYPFAGEVVNKQQMRVKEWTVIEITSGAAPLKKILAEIYEAVGEGVVWRGFTGPPQYHNYRLWVDYPANVGYIGNFTVTGYKGPFSTEDSGKYQGQQGYCFTIE